jgi:hypothetical protein
LSAAVVYPTVLVGLGRFGHEVVDRVLHSLDGGSPLLGVLRCEPGGLAAGLQPLLEELLRAGRGDGERRDPRLDLFVFAGALQGGDGDLLSACEQAARLVAEGYGAIFPPDRPPEQRAAGLHLVVQVPALSHPRAAVALERLAAVEGWARSRPASSLLSRIWLVSQQSSAGTLTSGEMVSTCAAFATALAGSGLRTEDAVARRMAHPARGEGPVGFVSVVSAEVPESRVRDYATARAAYDGLGTLVTRMEQVKVDPALAQGAMAALQHERWWAPLTDGEAARMCRREASALSRLPTEVPPLVQVGPFDAEGDLRPRYPMLFRREAPPPLSKVGDVRREELFRQLDGAEHEVAAAVEQGVHSVFGAWLGPASGLAQLPHVAYGLEQVIAQLRDQQAREAATQAKEDSGQQKAEEGVPFEGDGLEESLKALPSRKAALGTALALAVAVLLLTVAAVLAFQSPPAAPSTGTGPATLVLGPSAATTPTTGGIDWRELAPWLAGGALALLVALGGTPLVGHLSRRDVRRALERRRQVLADWVNQGERGAPGGQAEAQLRVRRLRALRGALLALENAVERLRVVRQSLLGARDRARQALVGLGITPAAEARQDDLQPLIGAGMLLHGLLLPPDVLARWVASCREVSEDRVWADRLLEGAWPAGGLFEGAPCDDPARVDALSRQQVRPLSTRSLFEDPEVGRAAADTLRDFSVRAGSVLAPPCQPQDAHGDPVQGVRPGEGFVIAPLPGREVLQDSLRDVPFRLPVLWSPLKSARVLFVRTWEGLTVEDVVRGARALGVGPQAAAARGRG